MKARPGGKIPLTAAFQNPESRAGNSTKDEVGTPVRAAPLPSFPPCLTPADDGIFRAGGGGPGMVSKTFPEYLLVS